MADPQALGSHPSVERRCFAPPPLLSTKAVASEVAAAVIVASSSSIAHNRKKRSSRDMSLARIQRELQEIERDPPPFCWVSLKEQQQEAATPCKRPRLGDNNNNAVELLSAMNKKQKDAYTQWVDSHHYWECMLTGPHGTPYEGGIFFLDIILPERYPFEAPQIKFTTPIYHCNIWSTDGQICCWGALQREWSPARTVATILHSIVSLLTHPEAVVLNDKNKDTMASSDKARRELFTTDRTKFDETAREFTRKYAM